MNDNFNSRLIFDNISYLIKEQGKKSVKLKHKQV